MSDLFDMSALLDVIRLNRVVCIKTVDGQAYDTSDMVVWVEEDKEGTLVFLDEYGGYGSLGPNNCRTGVLKRTVVFAKHIIDIELTPAGDADFVR